MLLPVLGVEAAPSSASYGRLAVQGTGEPKAGRAGYAGNPLPGVGAFGAVRLCCWDIFCLQYMYISVFTLLEYRVYLKAFKKCFVVF